MIIKSPNRKQNARPNVRSASQGTRRRPNGQSGSNGHAKVYGKPLKEKKQDDERKVRLSDIKPWKIIVASIALGVFGVLYISHVFRTQRLLRDVQKMEQRYNKAKRRHDEYKLTYDRMIGPAEIYNKAKEQGFINGGPAEKVITIEK